MYKDVLLLSIKSDNQLFFFQTSSNQGLSFLRCELSGYQLLLTLLNFPIGMKKCLVTTRKRSLRKKESPLFDQEWNKLTTTNNDYGSQGMKMNILGHMFGLNELKKEPLKPANSAQRNEKVPGKFSVLNFVATYKEMIKNSFL